MVDIRACRVGMRLLLSVLLLIAATLASAQAAKPTSLPAPVRGKSLFASHCAFCHGRDAGGGETGPDLTRSKLVTADVGGDKIGDVVLHGRPDKGMPAFNFSAEQITNLAAFIHAQQNRAVARTGGRKGVALSSPIPRSRGNCFTRRWPTTATATGRKTGSTIARAAAG